MYFWWDQHTPWRQCCMPVEQLAHSYKSHRSSLQHKGHSQTSNTWSIWHSLPWPCQNPPFCSRWREVRTMTNNMNHNRCRQVGKPSTHAKCQYIGRPHTPYRNSICIGTLSGDLLVLSSLPASSFIYVIYVHSYVYAILEYCFI